MLTKGAIGNLVNRYRAVLKKCNLINTFGSLAVAAMLVMGGAGVAMAAKPNLTALNAVTITSDNYPHGVDDYIYGARLDAQMEIATPLGWSVGLGSNSYELKLNNKDMVDQLLIGGRYAGVSVDRYKDSSKYVYSDGVWPGRCRWRSTPPPCPTWPPAARWTSSRPASSAA